MARSERIAPGISIRQSETGKSWQLRVFWNGRQKARSLGTTRITTARRKAYAFAEEYEGRLHAAFEQSTPASATALEAFEHYRQAKAGLIKPNSIEDALAIVSLFYRDFSSVQIVSHTLTSEIDSFVRRSDIAPSTRSGYYTRLHAFFQWCVDAGYFSRHPMANIKKPKRERKLPVFLTKEDLGRLCDTITFDAKAHPHYKRSADPLWLIDVIRFSVATGLRRSELIHLRWRDVDSANGLFFVRAWGGFTLKSWEERTVPIFPMAQQVLRIRQDKRRSEDDTETVFIGQAGRKLYGNFVSQRFRAYKRMAGLQEAVNYHSLRKTFGCWCAQNGISMRQIQQWMGHKDITTTQIYASVAPTTYADQGAKIFS